MKELKEYLTENNFFKNLGIGIKSQTDKWIEENNLNKLSDIVFYTDEDGGLVIVIDAVKSIFGYTKTIKVPKFVTLSKIVLKRGSYGGIHINSADFEDFENFIGSAVVENELSGTFYTCVYFNNCNIDKKDIEYIPKDFEDICIQECPKIKGNLNITLPHARHFSITDCDINNVSLIYKHESHVSFCVRHCKKLKDIDIKGDLSFLAISDTEYNNNILSELMEISGVEIIDIAHNDIARKKFESATKKSKLFKELISKNKYLNTIEFCHSGYRFYLEDKTFKHRTYKVTDIEKI